MKMTIALSLLLVLAASTPVTVRQRDVSVAEKYLAQVLRYYLGDHTSVIRDLARWSREDLQLALRGLPAALPLVLPRAQVGTSTAIASAMLVHVDIASRADTPAEIDWQLSIADRLSDLLPADRQGEAFIARWHHMAGTLMLRWSRPVNAHRHFAAARKLLPEDPEILLALGSVYEFEGIMRAQFGLADSRLKEARELYRSVVAAVPDLPEARLRFARTQLLLGDLDSAATAIAPIDRRTLPPHLGYLTLLIGGSIAEAAGRSDQAIAEYRQARALCKGCHSATLALSHALLQAGDRDAARELVENLVSDTTWSRREDPWWVYGQGQWHAADAVLEQLRRQVPR